VAELVRGIPTFIKRVHDNNLLTPIIVPQDDEPVYQKQGATLKNKILDQTCVIESISSLPAASRIIVGLSTDTKPSDQPEFTRYIERDTLEQFIFISGQWLNLRMSLRAPSIVPNIDFKSNRIYTSGGFNDFIHWVEPIFKSNKVIVPFSFLSASTPGGIALSDDGINFREVFRSVKANENFWLTAKDRGDLALVGSGSGGAFTVGSVFRSQDFGETWTEILSNTDVRVYGIDFSLPTGNAIIVTSGGGVPNNSGKIVRSQNISVGSPTFTTIMTLSEGCRCVRTVEKTGTILVGTGVTTGAGIYRSTDEGAIFTLVKRFSSSDQNIYWIQDVYDIISNTTKIFACLTNGKIYISTDDGATWSLFSSHYSYTASPIRRIIQYNDILYAANDIQGLSILDPFRGRLNPVNNELTRNLSAVPFYSIVKYKGSLSGSKGWDLLYSGDINPCSFNLWSNKSVTPSGLTSSAFSVLGHNKETVFIFSDQGGTLTIQALDQAAPTPTLRDMTPTVAITANTIKSVNLSDYANAGNIFAIKFVPSITANVNLWVVMD